MIHAYDSLYLEKARLTLACMFDHAVNRLSFKLADFFSIFIASDIADRFEHGDVSIVAGRSGIELAMMVAENTGISVNDPNVRRPSLHRSREYWMGWALAYYQWYTSLSFSNIVECVPANDIRDLYDPYHEMDIMQFCDHMNELMRTAQPETNLKRLRVQAGISQSQLAAYSDIPLRTIQQYEQRQKNINKAQVEYILKLSNVLDCSPDALIEKI